MRGKVALEGLEFHAYHGVYPHERSSGNKFEVDIMVETEFLEAALPGRPQRHHQLRSPVCVGEKTK